VSAHRIPAERLAAIDVIADATRTGPVVVACKSRTVRRQYLRAVTRRGGNPANIVFAIMPGLPDDAANQLRRRGVLGDVEIRDVREFAPLPSGCGRG
jgi:hypothetical protein